ncbi:MAG: hypothetical protein IPM16_11935 [Chloroflexi bacterium]|nr:hypothetical protein [Chloroflexota bacterium]
MPMARNARTAKNQNAAGSGTTRARRAVADVSAGAVAGAGIANPANSIRYSPTAASGMSGMACQPNGERAIIPAKIGPAIIGRPAMMLASAYAWPHVGRQRPIWPLATMKTEPIAQPNTNIDAIRHRQRSAERHAQKADPDHHRRDPHHPVAAHARDDSIRDQADDDDADRRDREVIADLGERQVQFRAEERHSRPDE